MGPDLDPHLCCFLVILGARFGLQNPWKGVHEAKKKTGFPASPGHMAAQEAFRARPGGSGASKSLQKSTFTLNFGVKFLDSFPRNATPKPPVAQRAGGISVYLSTYVCIHTPNVVFAPRVDLEGPCLYIHIYI